MISGSSAGLRSSSARNAGSARIRVMSHSRKPRSPNSNRQPYRRKSPRLACSQKGPDHCRAPSGKRRGVRLKFGEMVEDSTHKGHADDMIGEVPGVGKSNGPESEAGHEHEPGRP